MENRPGPLVVLGEDVEFAEPRWLLSPYFQRGKGTLIQADNGVGKTAMMCAVAAKVSTGQDLLGLPVQAPGNVLVLSVEDDVPVLRGRIKASGGDLNRCFFMPDAAGLTFNSPEVELAIRSLGVKLVIFDPFQAFLGAGVQMDKSNQTRPQLAKLFEMAARQDCAVAIIAHIGKGSVLSAAVNRSLGSVDIPAAMRSILHVVRNPDQPTQCLAVHIKSSNAPIGKTLAFTIGERGGVHWDSLCDYSLGDSSPVVSAPPPARDIPYEDDPLRKLFTGLAEKQPTGGYWSYEALAERACAMFGCPPFADVADLKAKLHGPLEQKLREREGIYVTFGHRTSNTRGIRVDVAPPG